MAQVAGELVMGTQGPGSSLQALQGDRTPVTASSVEAEMCDHRPRIHLASDTRLCVSMLPGKAESQGVVSSPAGGLER